MHEKRLVDRLSVYWDGLRGKELYPQIEFLKPDALDDMWERCLLLEIEAQSNSNNPLYTYQHMGREVIKAYGSDLTGHYVNVHMHNFPGWQVLKSVSQVFTDPTIQHSEGSFVNDMDQVVKYRACIMPFGNKAKITHALVGLSWKTFQ